MKSRVGYGAGVNHRRHSPTCRSKPQICSPAFGVAWTIKLPERRQAVAFCPNSLIHSNYGDSGSEGRLKDSEVGNVSQVISARQFGQPFLNLPPVSIMVLDNANSVGSIPSSGVKSMHQIAEIVCAVLGSMLAIAAAAIFYKPIEYTALKSWRRLLAPVRITADTLPADHSDDARWT
jgi:hypothetical protein